MEFLAIDFETASRYEYSPCSVAIYKFNKESHQKLLSTLINPGDVYFDPKLTEIHGITKNMVQNAPSIKDVLNEICHTIEKQFLFAHNASFDIHKIIDGCNQYNISIPSFKYADSLMLSKRTWTGLINYKLNTVCDFLHIDLDHHNADSDTLACGNIVLKAMEAHNTDNLYQLLENIKYSYGFYDANKLTTAFSHSNSNINSKSDYQTVKEIEINTNCASLISGKVIAFTGALSISREEAMKLAAKYGATPAASVTKQTNYLVVGNGDYGNFKLGNKSNKMLKAEQLIAKGQDLEMINEDYFYELLDYDKEIIK